MIYFRGIHFNTKKDLYINFQNHASIFCKEILIKINGGGHGKCYVLPTRVCDTANNYLPIEDIYIDHICQHALENILNVSKKSIKSLHQLTKPHELVGQFPNRHKGNKEAYDSIDYFLHQLKEDNDEPIATIYVG